MISVLSLGWVSVLISQPRSQRSAVMYWRGTGCLGRGGDGEGAYCDLKKAPAAAAELRQIDKECKFSELPDRLGFHYSSIHVT